ncbi:hypothetical protein COB11_02815 [Candidatus Aerophobetes bacterium]|uniref:UPF0301 protein COB11_02815 n=1 Tax=Aerophobetes bacterium TaxID=2030807 RepID=A0A2A4YKC4_UNCAE|nr:MAG: hypothetical protein COB11_02815 [Candidatus Aerophobetes bacterium]
MEKSPYSQLKKGSILIASPEVEPSLFSRSVILLCEHSQSGSFGLILNKPVHVDMPEEILDMNNMANSSISVRAGGPIQPNQMMLLHDNEELASTLKVCENVFLGGDLEFLQEAISASSGPSVMLCFGYAGWGPGLLEREFLNGAWILSKGSHEYIFKIPSETLWRQVLRDKGGKYTTLSLIPEDLDLN